MDELLTLNFPANDLVLLPGTPNDDELLGSLQNEGLLSYGGNDRAIGYGGDDWLFGNEGNDSLYGNEGADILRGGKANDILFGGLDNDILFGDLGNDQLFGESGRDILVGGEGQDRFAIGRGDSTLVDADLIWDYSAGEDWLELTDGLTFANLDIVAGTGANANDTTLLDRVTGESVAILRGFEFDRFGGTEFGNDEMTLLRLHQIAPELPEDPIESPADPLDDDLPDDNTPVVEIDRDIPQLNTAEREITTDPGNTPEDAYRLAVSSTTLVYTEQVSSSDTDDYYVFSLGADNSITLSLDGLAGNAEISLLDSNQTVIGSSRDPNAIGKLISSPLEGGTYYIRVESADMVTTDYNLNLSVTPRLSGITTTDSQEEYELFTNESTPLINLTPSDGLDTEALRTDPRFANIDGSGYSTVIIDTGIDLDHPFFGDRIVYSYDFADNDADASDRNGHGSNVSSIVASENSIYPGVAPGANIIHLKVFSDIGDGGAKSADIQQALQWVKQNAEDFNIVSVNMSLGAGNFEEAISIQDGYSQELAALVEQNIIVVSAAGNDFRTFDSAVGVAYPAADPNSLAVGAVFDSSELASDRLGPFNGSAIAFSSDADRIAPWSQRHPELTDIFAPGPDSTGANWDGGVITQGGTSQASPHIAGVAVLAQQLAEQELGRRLTLDEFRNLLQSTGVTINDGDDEDDNVFNTGANYQRVDVLALAEAIVELDAPPTPEPEPSNLVRYDFTYYYDGFTTDNDYYTGYVYGEAGELQVGTLYDIVSPDIDNEAGFDGYYYITDARDANSNAQAGEVYVDRYFDVNSSVNSYTPYYFQNGYASGFNGIGSEYDFVVANGNFDDFGRDFAQVDVSRVTIGDGGDDDDGGSVNGVGGLFVSSNSSNQVLRFDETTGDFIETFISTGSGGLANPIGLTSGPDGNLYVSSVSTNEVLRYDGTTGDFIDVFASGGGLNDPQYLIFGPDGNLYVSGFENDGVLRYDGMTGDFIDVFASGGGLNETKNLIFGPDGNLYVVGLESDGVLRYDGLTGDFIDLFASGGGLDSPNHLAFGLDGNLYVSSRSNAEVLRYDGITGDFIDTFIPTGRGGLYLPGSLEFRPDGNLYVSSNTDEILRYDGITGDFIDVFASGGSLDRPLGLVFVD